MSLTGWSERVGSNPRRAPRHRRLWHLSGRSAIALGLLLGTVGLANTASAASSSSGSICGSSTRDAACAEGVARQSVSLEQQLADAFAPIVMLKRQEHPCDRNGEAYLPAPVEVVFDDPEVALVRVMGRSRSELIKMAPSVSDLVGEDDTYHLNFPGNPRRPGCGYERWFRQRMPGHEPTTYANIVSGQGRVAIQYWFWYVFNDFNNTHEGDWEMIQLIFAAESVTEALQEQPVEVGFASHGGGERAGWDDEKLTKEGNHPVVYAGSGSHASKYGSGTYLAWGEDNTGFGCDDTTGPSDRVPLKTIALPHDLADATGSLAWLAWPGRWGELQPAFYNGPEGPGVRERWRDPFSWQDTLRDSSLKIPESVTFGPGPTGVFCTAVAYGSFLLTRFAVYPWLIVLVLVAAAVVMVLVTRSGWSTLLAAWRTYLAGWHLFVALGLVLIPVGLLANAVQFVFVDYPPGKQLLQTMDSSPGARLAIALTIGGLQDLVSLVLVGPAVIAAVGALEAGRSPSFAATYRLVFRHLRALAGAVARSLVVIALLTVSVVGIPWAIERGVRWLFVSQAVLLDGAGAREALRASARVVTGRWWRTAATAAFLWIAAVAPGPIVGLALLVLATPEVRYVNWLSSLVYAVMLPLSVIGMTLLYQNLKRDKQHRQADATRADESSAGPAAISPAPTS
jgi:hypothetical protein